MKTNILLTAILFTSITANAQAYIGGSLGLGFAKGWSEKRQAEVSFQPKTFVFSMPIGYNLNNWLFEFTPAYALGPEFSGLAGKRVSCFELLAGIHDNTQFQLKPIQMRHDLSYDVTGRFVIKDFYFEVKRTGAATYLSIGTKGFLSE